MKNKLLIRNGRIYDKSTGLIYESLDILVEDNKIIELGKNLKCDDCEVLNLDGETVTYGFIDIHTHVDCNELSEFTISPDLVGVKQGVPIIIDAGTKGVDGFEEYYERINKCDTKVYFYLNVSSEGITDTFDELADLESIKPVEMENIVNKYRNRILGIKIRSSSDAVGANGIRPLIEAKKIASKVKLPLIVHLWEGPPAVSEILSYMESGDIVTHCFNKLSHSLFDDSGKPFPEVIEAKNRGVLFDVGHGTSSFSFEVAGKAIKLGFKPDLIGTDIYSWNYNGPVYDLATTMSKLVAAGMSMEECIDRVTYIPSGIFNLNDFGKIEVGKPANFSIFRVENKQSTLVDSMNMKFTANKTIKMKYAICDGVIHFVGK